MIACATALEPNGECIGSRLLDTCNHRPMSCRKRADILSIAGEQVDDVGRQPSQGAHREVEPERCHDFDLVLVSSLVLISSARHLAPFGCEASSTLPWVWFMHVTVRVSVTRLVRQMHGSTGMIASQPSKPAEHRRVPHSVFGIGAFLLVLLAAFVLILLSGELTRNSAAVMFVAIIVAAVIAFTVLITKRWRRARLGRTSALER